MQSPESFLALMSFGRAFRIVSTEWRCGAAVKEAAELAIEQGVYENCTFNLARAIKAFEVTTGSKLPRAEFPNAFNIWWGIAQPLLPSDADRDEYLLTFYDAMARAKSPLGSNSLKKAIEMAKSQPLPAESSLFSNENVKQLIAVCFHLQKLAGNSPFFLSLRACAEILGKVPLERASRILNGLVEFGLLRIAKKGVPGNPKATRFRFVVQNQPQGKKP
jgi:hypothetical protein